MHDALTYLIDLAAAVVEASRVRPGDSVAGYGPNTTGATLIRPGGRACYPAFWIRDFAMSLESAAPVSAPLSGSPPPSGPLPSAPLLSGLIHPDEAEHALRLTARLQAPADRTLRSGSFVPRGSIADHITFDGQPIFYPGTIDDVENQGAPWGYLPSLDDHYYFVEMAWHVAVACSRRAILTERIDGVALLDRLAVAFDVPRVRPATGLVWCDEADRGVSFGFTDTVVHTGELLFCSLLRQRAARQMADLVTVAGRPDQAARYAAIADTLATHIPATFAHPSGFLRASTGLSAQPDVWGTAFAVYTGAVPEPVADRLSHALHRALLDGAIAWRGQIRHVPTWGDHRSDSAWERVVGGFPHNHYQNGAYWGSPLGWVCAAIARVDEPAAQQLALDYVAALQPEDFRRGDDYGAPFECMHPDGDHRQNPVYMASVTCPLGAFRRLGWI